MSATREFRVQSPFQPAGDQPQAIAALSRGVLDGLRFQTLEGITGSGKTATIAWMVEQLQRPMLVIEPNKSLAAQLAAELKDMLPDNRVEFFVSYYDYYQPEAYIARTDTYIEKDSSINDEIDRLRHASTSSLLTRRDTLVVASVSCIYGLGSPEEYRKKMVSLVAGEECEQRALLRRLVDMHYSRNDMTLLRGTFRVRGDTIELLPSYEQEAIRLSFFGDTLERIALFDPLTGDVRTTVEDVSVYAASHYVAGDETMARAIASIEAELQVRLAEFQSQGKLLEVQRLRARTEHDLEMLSETGTCAGIENYSRHLDGRQPGERPYTLLDYFPEDFLVVVDESHVAVPQLNGQYAGDKSRKDVLVEHGFRLPSALDNRPLRFEEFLERVPQVVFVSATPGPYEAQVSDAVVEQVIRPTGLVDPPVEIVPTRGQIDDLRARIAACRRRRRPRARHDAHEEDGRGPHDLPRRGRGPGPVPALGHRHDRAHRDPPVAAARRVRRARRHQPAPRGARPARGGPRRDPRRRQGGVPALELVAHPDDRPCGAQLAGTRGPLRRHAHRLDAHGDVGDRAASDDPARVQRRQRHRPAVDHLGGEGHPRPAPRLGPGPGPRAGAPRAAGAARHGPGSPGRSRRRRCTRTPHGSSARCSRRPRTCASRRPPRSATSSTR